MFLLPSTVPAVDQMITFAPQEHNQVKFYIAALNGSNRNRCELFVGLGPKLDGPENVFSTLM
jgi:hypothetical protein